MTRLLGGCLLALLIAACTQTPLPTAPSASETPPPEPAMLNVTGSGILCVPWWYGCGAYLAVESQGWVLPIPWAPDAADIGFSVRITGRDRVRVTGAEQAGNDRIEPGAYTLVVIRTSRPEGVTPEPTMSAAVGCAVDLDVPPGTRVVSVDVEFSGPACTIEASLDAASAAPSP